MCLEQYLVDILVPINDPLFLPRQMQFPVHEHRICVRYSWLEILAVEIIDSKDGARDADEIY